MYIIMGWVQFYHLCEDVVFYFITEPTVKYMILSHYMTWIIAKSFK